MKNIESISDIEKGKVMREIIQYYVYRYTDNDVAASALETLLQEKLEAGLKNWRGGSLASYWSAIAYSVVVSRYREIQAWQRQPPAPLEPSTPILTLIPTCDDDLDQALLESTIKQLVEDFEISDDELLVMLYKFGVLGEKAITEFEIFIETGITRARQRTLLTHLYEKLRQNPLLRELYNNLG